MMGHRTPGGVDGAEWDVLHSRRYYCYLKRAGVTAGIKRQMRRRERRAGKAETR